LNHYTPAQAVCMFKQFFEHFPELCRAVIRNADLIEFNAAVEVAEAISQQRPSASTCGELELCLGLLANLLLDAPLLATKPMYQVQTVIDAIEITGAALSIAAGTPATHQLQ
jgi:hypothetical protein